MEHLTFWRGVLIAPFVLFGCESVAPDAADVLPVSQNGDVIAMGMVNAPVESPIHLPPGDPDYEAAAQAMITEAATVWQRPRKLLREGAPFAQIDEAVREVFAADLSPEARWFVETNLGMAMLRPLLDTEALDVEAVAFYTERLVRHGNPNADLLSDGLRRAEPVLSTGEVAELARIAARSAADHLERRCGDCGQPDARVRTGIDRRDVQIAEALADLDVLASAR